MSRLQTLCIGEFCKTGSGSTPSRSELAKYYDGGTIPWVKSGELREGVILEAEEHVTHTALAETSIKLVPKGAILLAMYGATVGRLALLGIEATTNQAVCHIVPDPSVADTRYLFHALSSQVPAIVAMGVGGAQPNISQGVVKNLKIWLPPLPEQRRIAAILDKADALRTKRREALAQLDRLAQSIFVEMFGDPATNPKGWAIRTLKELGKVCTGGTPPSSSDGMFGGDIPFVTPGDLERDQSVRRTVTEAGAQAAGIVRAGAALVCCIGATIGKMGMASMRSSFNQQLNSVEWYPASIDDYYGLAALRFFKPTIIAWGASTTLPILKKSSFEKVAIPVPPLPLQQQFAKKIAALENWRADLKAHLELTDILFLALQSRAFSEDL